MECSHISRRDSTPDAERGVTVGGTLTQADTCRHMHAHSHIRILWRGVSEERGTSLCPTGAPFSVKLHPLWLSQNGIH